jgi:two-component sensor histidine kinase
MKVRQLMDVSHNPASSYASVESVEQRLLEDQYLVVADDGVFRGLLRPIDIVSTLYTHVGDCLRPQSSVGADEPLSRALEIMNAEGARVLPVFENEQFVGVIHQQSIAEYLDDYQIALNEQVNLRTEELMEEVRVRRETEIRLQKALDEKTVLLHELHHRTKNTLQLILGIISLKAPDEETDSWASDFVRDIEQRIHSVAAVHQRLLRSENLSRLDLKEYAIDILQNLIDGYAPSDRKIELHVTGKLNNVDADIAIPCGLILTELASNSIKHAFGDAGAGSISLHVSSNDSTITLSYRDSGSGMKQNSAKTARPGVGMQLIRALVEDQLCGHIVFGDGPGFSCVVRFDSSRCHTGLH